MSSEQFSRSQKQKYLLEFDEDAFRDSVIRPLFDRQGAIFIRDTCGADEQGKDCICIGNDTFGTQIVYAVQTKTGNLNMSGSASKNLTFAETQLRTALVTDIFLNSSRQKVKPDVVYLCVSGRMNELARRYMYDNLNDRRIRIEDANDLIPKIDALFPEFWHGIDARKFPYLKRIKEELLRGNDIIPVSESSAIDVLHAPITNETYTTLYLVRVKPVVKKDHGVVTFEPKVDQIKVESLIRQPDKLFLIVGEGGSGKTIALRRLAYSLCEAFLSSGPTTPIPVYIKATDLARSTKRLIELVGDITSRYTPNENSCFSIDDLNSGLLVVLVDALDEVALDDDKSRILERISDFHSEYPNCKVVVTTRDYTYLRRLPQLKAYIRYDISSLNLAQAGKIVDCAIRGRRITGTASKESMQTSATEILRQLQDIHGMALSPFLVTVFVASTDFAVKDIPPNITEIFSKFTEMMLGRWDERKGLSQQFQYRIKDFLLCKLAYKMHSERATSISVTECRDIFSELITEMGQTSDSNVLIDEIVYRSGVLQIEEDEVRFRHHLFQEYFAGRGVACSEDFESGIADDWWRRAVIFYFGANASKLDELTALAHRARSRSSQDQYAAAITIGLALQSCYLANIDRRTDLLEWVIDTLASSCDAATQYFEQQNSYPLTALVSYYLFAKDAVACDLMVRAEKRIFGEGQPLTDDKEKEDLKQFWVLVGLIDAGYLNRVEPLLRRFQPSDKRLLLGVHLGCFLASHIKVLPQQQKQIAHRICKVLEPKIRPYAQTMMREFKSMLLEIRRGQITSIEVHENILPADEKGILASE